MLKFIIISVILMVPVAVYLFCYIRRTISFWSRQGKRRWITVLSVLFAVGIAAVSTNVFSTGALVVLHLSAIGICMELLNFIVVRAAGRTRELKRWRQIYRSGIPPILITVLILCFGYYHMNDVQQTDYTVSTDKQLRPEGYRIALITDLHFGTTMDHQKLEAYCMEISKFKPDFLYLLGRRAWDDKCRFSANRGFSGY